MKLISYWFEFESIDETNCPFVLRKGCGVTAYDYNDAISLLHEKIFIGDTMPAIKKIIESIEVSELDQNHVVPNMGIIIARGIWFPLGY